MINRMVGFSHGRLPKFLQDPEMRLCNNLGNKSPSNTYWKDHQWNAIRPLKEMKVSYELLDHFRNYRNVIQFHISFVSHESSRKRLQETDLPCQIKKEKFTFVENTISDLPKVSRTRFQLSNKLFCFISKEVWQPQKPFCRDYFALDKEDWLGCYKQKKYFNELWWQNRQLRTMKMHEAWFDIHGEGYKHQLWPRPTHKIRKHYKYLVYTYSTIKHLLDDHEIAITTRIVKNGAMTRSTRFWVWTKVIGHWDKNKGYIKWNISLKWFKHSL